MTTMVTGLTADRMLTMEAATIVNGHIDGTGELILTKHDGSTVDAGPVTAAGITLTPGYLSLPGTGKALDQAPNAAGLNVPADLDIRVYGTLGAIVSGAIQTLIMKQTSAAFAWNFRMAANGRLQLLVSADGTTSVAANGNVLTPTTPAFACQWRKSDGRTQFFIPNSRARTITDGATFASGTPRVLNSATAAFTVDDVGLTVSGPGIASGTTIQTYTSPTQVQLSANATVTATGVTLVFGTTFADASKWNQVGADQTASTAGAALYSGAVPVTIGAAANGTVMASAGTKILKVEIRNGLDGTLVASPDFTNSNASNAIVTDAQGNPWTIGGAARIQPVTGSITNNGKTLTLVSADDIRTMAPRWGYATRNPLTGWFHVDDYGPVGVNPAQWTTAQTGAAARAARAAAVASIDIANGLGATVYFQRQLYMVDVDPTIVDPYTGLNYCALATWDYLEYKGATHYGTIVKIDAGMDCHVFGHPGRLQADGSQDAIFNTTFTDIIADGNRSQQAGTHVADGFHLDQHNGVHMFRSIGQNCDGKGYYNTANGEFGTGGVHLNREVIISQSKMLNNSAEGFFCSAATRATSYSSCYSDLNGSPQARVVGKTVAQPLTASGNFIIQFDNNAVVTVALASGDLPSAVVTKINTALGTTTAIASDATIVRWRQTVTDAVLNSTTALTSATANFTAADVGQLVMGDGIPRGTVIQSRTNATTVVLSAAATATGTGVSVAIGTNVVLTPSANSATWTVGAKVSGQGIPAGTVIGAVTNGVSFTMVDGSSNPVPSTVKSVVGAGVITINGKGKAALTTKPVSAQAATDTITFTSPHHAVVGTSMVFGSLVGAAGITAGTTYYVHAVISSTQVTLTTTAGGGGSTLDITTDGTAVVTAGSLARLLLISDTVGGISKVYMQSGSTVTGVLANLGLTLTPSQANSDFNNYRVGSNEYAAAYLDHSECHISGFFCDSNYGDAFRIHNVDSCHYDNLHATRNNGLGIYADAFDHSTGKGWLAKMNGSDFGAASYRNPVVGAEYYFDSGTEGYGVTHDTTLIGINGPGDKTTGGNDLDNRFFPWAVYIASGVAANGSFDIIAGKYGDGGILGTVRDDR